MTLALAFSLTLLGILIAAAAPKEVPRQSEVTYSETDDDE